MENLHQNTGKNQRSVTIGRLFMLYNRAEDPSLPWWRRSWQLDHNGVRTTMLLSIQKGTTGGQSAYFVYIGPFMFAFAWIGG